MLFSFCSCKFLQTPQVTEESVSKAALTLYANKTSLISAFARNHISDTCLCDKALVC